MKRSIDCFVGRYDVNGSRESTKTFICTPDAIGSVRRISTTRMRLEDLPDSRWLDECRGNGCCWRGGLIREGNMRASRNYPNRP